MFIVSASNPLAWVLDINRLTNTEYIDWLTNLRIILNFRKLSYVLYQVILILQLIQPIVNKLYLMSGWTMIIKIGAMHEHMFTANDVLIHLQVLWGDQSRITYVMHDE